MKLVSSLAVALILSVLLGAGARAAEEEALGTWDLIAQTPNGPMPSVLTLTRAEGKLKAEVELGGAKRDVSDETLEGDVLRLKVQYEGVTYALEGKIAKKAIEGTWEGGGNSGTFQGKKRG
jgi:hypothetical protein